MKEVILQANGENVTPYIDGGVTLFNGKSIYLERPKFAEIYLIGVMPTDTSDNRTPETLDFDLKVGDKIVLRAKCELSIQGHGSVSYDKKGYTFDILNKDGESLAVKFGDMIASDSYHLKGYATDTTHTRCIGNCNLWRSMIASLGYPYNLFANRGYNITANQEKNEVFTSDAKFAEDGFNVSVFLNGEFFGLYTLKLKKSAANYALNNKNVNNIFLDSRTYTAFLSQGFDKTDWELKSPKISGYIEGGDITNTDVLSNIQRLFSFLNGIQTQYASHEDYIVLKHWIVWVIFSELISNRDTNGNNYELMTWDGLHWSISPYDTDLTLGLNAWSNYTIEQERSGMDIASANGTNDQTFWNRFKSVYSSEIKAVYADFRNRKIIDMETLPKFYIEQAQCVPRDVYDSDRKKWASIWTNGEPNLQQIFTFLKSRIDYLDSVWL